MPRLVRAVPKYRKHSPSGRAFVELNGRRHYLGPHGSQTRIDEYDQLIAKWLGRGRRPAAAQAATSVTEVLVAYVKFAATYYRKYGKETSEVGCIKDALKYVRRLYGRQPAEEFGPLALRAAREQMIEDGLARSSINGRVSRMWFKWAASEELVSASIPQALKTLSGLRPRPFPRQGDAAHPAGP